MLGRPNQLDFEHRFVGQEAADAEKEEEEEAKFVRHDT